MMPSSFSATMACFRTLCLCCGLFVFSGQLRPQGVDAQKNLRDCMTGFGYCNHALLSPSELSEVKEAEHQRNFQHCKTGFGYCDHSLLTPEERPVVREAEHERNLQHCKTGFGYCDHSLLNADELPDVKEAEHQRNLQHCTTGFGYCDHSLLNRDEIPAVREAEHQRNLQHCKTGFGYCDHALLSPDEIPEVRQAEWQRNYHNCQTGFGPCNRQLLDKPPEARSLQGRPSPSLIPPPAESIPNKVQETGTPTNPPPALDNPIPTQPKSGAEPAIKAGSANTKTTQRKEVKKDVDPQRRVIFKNPPNAATQTSPSQMPPPPLATSAQPTTPSTDDSFSVLLIWAVVIFMLWLAFKVIVPWVKQRWAQYSATSQASGAAEILWGERPIVGTGTTDYGWREVAASGNAGTNDNAGALCPVDARPLDSGQSVCRCNTPGCQTGYHRDCWDFLQRENHGTCVSCGRASGVTSVASSGPRPTQETDVVPCPQCGTQNRVNRWLPRASARCGSCRSRLFPGFSDSFSTEVIGLDRVRERVGQIVVFRGKVLEMRKVRGGAYLLKFERGQTGRAFKLYIPDRYVPTFRSRGVRIENYLGNTVEVRGLVQRHPRWNYEIVVIEPNAIRAVTSSEWN